MAKWVLTAVFTVLFCSAVTVFAEVNFDGTNIRLGYVNSEETDDELKLHCLEVHAKSEADPFLANVVYRLGEDSNYLLEGWAGYTDETVGTVQFGKVGIPFGIFINGLYSPRGLLQSGGYMETYDYGLCWKKDFGFTDIITGYLRSDDRVGPSGRLGIQTGTGSGFNFNGGISYLNRDDTEDDVEFAHEARAIDAALSFGAFKAMIECIDYDIDIDEGSYLMGQIGYTIKPDLTNLKAGTPVLHYSKKTADEGDDTEMWIGQIKISLSDKLAIFPQYSITKVGAEDEEDVAVWVKYIISM